jgi:carbon-monoxide dehydrogenase large subunit
VQTNKVPTGPYRGAGRPDAAYMIERLVDDAARALGIDRVALRRQNLIRRFPHRTALGLSYDSGDYERCLDHALELAKFEEFEDRDLARTLGTGVALFVERAGGMWESAAVEVCEDGRLLVRSSASPHGQGHDTTFAQIAADKMGMGIDEVVLRFGDSAEVPAGVGTFGSRSTAMAGSAIVVALEKLIEEGRRRAATALGAPLGGVRHDGGQFIAEDRRVSLAELARREPLTASARFQSELVFSSGAYAAVVEIDRASGRLHVLRIAAVDDAGNLINPLLARGQVIGGTVQGLGECLVEEAAYAPDGAVPFSSFMNYSLLTAAEIPEIRTGEVVTPTPLNPLGAKGVGEGGTIGTLAAVANAVVDALRGHHVDPPFRDEKLWREIS